MNAISTPIELNHSINNNLSSAGYFSALEFVRLKKSITIFEQLRTHLNLTKQNNHHEPVLPPS